MFILSSAGRHVLAAGRPKSTVVTDTSHIVCTYIIWREYENEWRTYVPVTSRDSCFVKYRLRNVIALKANWVFTSYSTIVLISFIKMHSTPRRSNRGIGNIRWTIYWICIFVNHYSSHILPIYHTPCTIIMKLSIYFKIILNTRR